MILSMVVWERGLGDRWSFRSTAAAYDGKRRSVGLDGSLSLVGEGGRSFIPLAPGVKKMMRRGREGRCEAVPVNGRLLTVSARPSWPRHQVQARRSEPFRPHGSTACWACVRRAGGGEGRTRLPPVFKPSTTTRPHVWHFRSADGPVNQKKGFPFLAAPASAEPPVFRCDTHAKSSV